MSNYIYTCDNCNFYAESDKPIEGIINAYCKKCKKGNIARKCNFSVLVKGEIKTLGQQIDANTKRMGRNEVAERAAQQKPKARKASEKFMEQTGGKNIETSGETPWWRPSDGKVLTPSEADKVAKEIGMNINIEKENKVERN